MFLFNSLTGKKEEFAPLDGKKVKMYSCGPTVYNYFHIGNARPFIVFDSLRNYLDYQGFDVTFVQNFTDIDDKIIARAVEENVDYTEISERFIKEYFVDSKAIGIKEADVHPRATECIGEIIEFVQRLIDKEVAYESGGDVFFAVEKFGEYGKLSGNTPGKLEPGARIESSELKRHPLDFCLWKGAQADEVGFEAPFGRGRPGWHIECSAMAYKFLGETIDIHSGGCDLAFPHHENEIAQSETAFSKPFARFWLHNGHINVDNQKMSKSLGNFFTVRDVLKDFDGEVVRFFILSSHYRSPINFSKDIMNGCASGLKRLYNCTAAFTDDEISARNYDDDMSIYPQLDEYRKKFFDGLDNDFNTAVAIAVLFDIAKAVNSSQDKKFSVAGAALMKRLASVLGLLQGDNSADIDAEAERLIKLRSEARENRDFAEADKLRDKLLEMGIILEDTRDGVKWRRL